MSVGSLTVDLGTTTTLAATNVKAGSHALSSGSRWIVLTTAFPNANYHVAVVVRDSSVGNQQMVGIGSVSAGSFILMGSLATSTAVVDWHAYPRQA